MTRLKRSALDSAIVQYSEHCGILELVTIEYRRCDSSHTLQAQAKEQGSEVAKWP